MTKQLKTWTTLGLAALGSATLAQAAKLPVGNPPALNSSLLLTQIDAEGEGEAGSVKTDEAGEGGEAGESSVSVPSSYELGSTDPNAYKYDARPQIEAYVDLVHYAYEKAHADAAAMKTAIDALLASPSDATLAAARQTWIAARPSFMRTQAFRFYDGPVEGKIAHIDAWPVDGAHIDGVEGKPDRGLINDTSFKLTIKTLEAGNQKPHADDVTVGWHVIEFLLWGENPTVNRPYTDYIANQDNNERRRLYLQLVTDELVHEFDELAEAWEKDEANSYATRFLALPPREAIGRMVNGIAILAGHHFKQVQVDAGIDSKNHDVEESRFSQTTRQDFTATFEGLRQVWSGDSEGATRPGLDDLVFNIDSATAGKVSALFTAAEAKLNAIGDPWKKVLAAPEGSVELQAAEDLVTALEALSGGLAEAGNKLGVLVLVP